jgi:hypothetical protein
MPACFTIALVLSAIAMAGCGGDPCLAGKSVFTGQLPAQCSGTTSQGDAPESAEDQKPVVYTVAGTATNATISYRHTGGSWSDVSGVTLPWSFAFGAPAGATLYVSAYNDGAPATITVAIAVDGVTVQSVTASGAAAIARVSATCC